MKKQQFVLSTLLVCSTLFLVCGCKVPPGVYDDSREYYLPFQAGYASYVAQGNLGYVSHVYKLKNAIDFMMPVNTDIVAARCGKVVEVVLSNPNINCYTCISNYITVEHSDGTQAKYVHLYKDDNPKVVVGQYVERGEFLGFSGNSGNSLSPHLHFEVWKDGDHETGDTLVVQFADVDKNGVPTFGNTYTSMNLPGTIKCYP
jgi:murein DD-endopeptidase MepM/ murein hydrolase activator NlpD